MGKLKSPIVHQDGKCTIKDYGLRQSCSWTSGPDWLQELKGLLQACKAQNSVPARREELRRMITDGTADRTEAQAALMALDMFSLRNPTKRDVVCFLAGCRVGERTMAARVLPAEPHTLAGKHYQVNAATARAERQVNDEEKKKRVEAVLKRKPDNQKPWVNNARQLAAEELKLSKRTIERATKHLGKKKAK